MKLKIFGSVVLCLALMCFLIWIINIPADVEWKFNLSVVVSLLISIWLFSKLYERISICEETKKNFGFLSGTWINKDMYFTLSDDRSCFYAKFNLPDESGSSRFDSEYIHRIRKGIYPSIILSSKDADLFKVNYCNNWVYYREIELFCYKNNETYILYQNKSQHKEPWNNYDIDDEAVDAEIKKHFPELLDDNDSPTPR